MRDNGVKEPDRAIFESLCVAILQHFEIHFTYKDKVRAVLPYLLVNENGMWYLLGTEIMDYKMYEGEKKYIKSIGKPKHSKTPPQELESKPNLALKNFALDRITALNVTSKNFTPLTQVFDDINKSKTRWKGACNTAVLYIDNVAKDYFKRRKVFTHYTLTDIDSKGFCIETKYSFDDEILSVVRQWIPYIRIIEPTQLREKLKKSLQEYLKNM